MAMNPYREKIDQHLGRAAAAIRSNVVRAQTAVKAVQKNNGPAVRKK